MRCRNRHAFTRIYTDISRYPVRYSAVKHVAADVFVIQNDRCVEAFARHVFYVYLTVGAAQLDPIGIKRRLGCEKRTLRHMRAVRSDAVGVFCARGFKQQRRSTRCKSGHGELCAVCAGKGECPVLERPFGGILHGHGKDSFKLIVASVLDKRTVDRSYSGKDDPVPEIDGKRGRVVPVSAVLTAVRSFRAVGGIGRIPGGCGCFRTVGAAPRDVRIIRRIGGRIDLRNAAVPICESGAEVPSLPAKSEIITAIRISAAAADTAIAILKRGLIFFWFPSFISVLRIVKYLQPPPAVILSINKLVRKP